MLTRVDSVEKINAIQKVYLDNFFNVINEIVVSEVMNAPMEGVSEKRVKDKEKTEHAKKEINEAAEQLLIEILDRETKNFIPLSQQISSPVFTFTMPAIGVITTPFSIQDRHFGIDKKKKKGTLITAIADGVVIYAEHTEKGENILIIQHSGNMISIYKNIDKLFKNEGSRVKSGVPIATMGNMGRESTKPYLHFEIWYNGAPLNPLHYFIGN
jgi:murein DD-endopeptidase MepM/ murein hydrolase activator NlpD